MRIQAKIQAMAASEILNIIPHSVYQDIKAKDPSPIFRAYVIGHEGESDVRDVSRGQRVLVWFASAVKKLVDKLQYGAKVFNGHASDNSHEDRTVIGEIAGKAVQTIKDKVSALAVTYIYPEFKSLPLDVASIEAVIDLKSDQVHGHNLEMGEITGLALGNSAVNKPGFPGATLISELQAFADKTTIQHNAGGGNLTELTINGVRDFIKAGKLGPSDLFGLGDLMSDSMVEAAIDKAKKTAVTGEYEHRQRDSEGFDKKKADIEAKHKKEIDTRDAEIKTLKTETEKTKADGLFATKAKDRKLTTKQVKFVDQEKPKFVPVEFDKLDAEVDTFLDTTLKEYEKTAAIFGEKTESTEGKKGGGEPGSEESGEANPLIP